MLLNLHFNKSCEFRVLFGVRDCFCRNVSARVDLLPSDGSLSELCEASPRLSVLVLMDFCFHTSVIVLFVISLLFFFDELRFDLLKLHYIALNFSNYFLNDTL